MSDLWKILENIQNDNTKQITMGLQLVNGFVLVRQVTIQDKTSESMVFIPGMRFEIIKQNNITIKVIFSADKD